MTLYHWQYFLALEQDVKSLTRYIEFTQDNMRTYSIELAKILMAATQEIDVVFKQICSKYGNSSDSANGYQQFLPKKYPKMLTIKVTLPYELEFTPFNSWSQNQTPFWWTANNKIKHHRHTHFNQASLESVLNATSGLMIANLYFYEEQLKEPAALFPSAQLFYSPECTASTSPSVLGSVTNYQLP